MIYYLNIPYNKYINRKDRDEYHETENPNAYPIGADIACNNFCCCSFNGN